MNQKGNTLVGSKLKLVVSEPWAFEADNGFSSFESEIISILGDAILIKSNTHVSFNSHDYNYFVCSPRLARDTIENLFNGVELWCGVNPQSEDKATSETPFDLSSWRGGGILGTLHRI